MRHNFFFKPDHTPKYECVLACFNDVVLIDRRLVPPYSKDLRWTRGKYKWLVYDCSDTRYFGEWEAFKTRKEAIADFVNRSLLRIRCSLCDMVDNTVAESAMNKARMQGVKIGDTIRNIENGWRGKVIGTEEHNGDLLLICQGVNWFTGTLDDDDKQWHDPRDVTIEPQQAPLPGDPPAPGNFL